MAEKEATVFIVDVSSHMKRLQKRGNHEMSALAWCMTYVHDKVFVKVLASRKTDYVAIVALGSTTTDHCIKDDDGSYNHVRIIIPFPNRESDELRRYT